VTRLRAERLGSDSRRRHSKVPSPRHHVQTDTGAHPAYYPMETWGLLPGGKVAGVWSWPLTFLYSRG